MVARRARGLRAELDLTQADLARRMGMSTPSMSERLRGVKDFDIDELDDLAMILGTTVPYLMGFTDVRSATVAAPLSAGSSSEPNIGQVGFIEQPEINEGQPVSAGLLRFVRHQGLEPRTYWLSVSPPPIARILAGVPRPAPAPAEDLAEVVDLATWRRRLGRAS